MNLSLKIAKRYFLSKKKRSFINIISLISMFGVGIGTMALVIVLSVFNGLEDLNRKIFKSFDPDVSIKPLQGKFFSISEEKLKQLSDIEGVEKVIKTIKDNALAGYAETQTVISFKGVDDNFIRSQRLNDKIIEGDYFLQKDSLSYAIIGVNVANMLSIRPADAYLPLVLSYPKPSSKSTSITENSVNEIGIGVSGIFRLEQSHDDYVYVPLEYADDLTEANGKITDIEILAESKANIGAIKSKALAIVGKGFEVKDQDEQNVELFRAIQVEKLFIFIALLFIIGIASFNIFFSLTMLAIDKTEDIKTMLSMGAERKLIQRIFLAEGAIVGLVGALVGLAIGLIICLLQQNFGIVKMGVESSIVENYPVKIKYLDLLLVWFALVGITLLASYFPAKRASSV